MTGAVLHHPFPGAGFRAPARIAPIPRTRLEAHVRCFWDAMTAEREAARRDEPVPAILARYLGQPTARLPEPIRARLGEPARCPTGRLLSTTDVLGGGGDAA